MRRASEPTDAGTTAAFRSARAVTFNEQAPRPADQRQGGRYRGPSDSGRDDPASLLKDFDSKLQSIQEVLARYQSERTVQGRGGAGAGAAAGAAGGAAAGGAGAPGGTGGAAGGPGSDGHSHEREPRINSAPSTARRWQPQQQQLKSHDSGQQQPQQQLQQKRVLNPANVMDEEVYVRHVLATPRRIKSAVPGVSRALSARIEYYRCHRDKAQEKAERAREEQLAAQRERETCTDVSGAGGSGAASTAAASVAASTGPPINFVEANRRSIVPSALPPSLQLAIETIRDQALSNLAASTGRSSSGRRGGGGGGGGGTPSSATASGSGAGDASSRSSWRPWSGMPPPSPSAAFARGSSAATVPYTSLTVSPVTTPATGDRPGGGGAASGGFYTSRTIGITSGPGGAGLLQPASEPEWEAAGGGGGTRPGGGAGRSAAAAAGGRHACVSWDGSADGDSGGGRSGLSSPSVFLTTVDVASRGAKMAGTASPTTGGDASSSSPAAPPSGRAYFGPGRMMGSASPVGAPPGGSRDESPTGRSRSPAASSGAATALPSRPATASTSSLAPYGYGVNGAAMRASTNSPGGIGFGLGSTGASGKGGPGSTCGSGDVSLAAAAGAGGVDTRRLRLALSARPASGGSPTKRMDFIAEHAARRVERAIYAAEVRERAAALDAERRRHIVALSEQRAAARREEEAKQVAARALAEKQERQRQWTAIVGLCSKLSFVAERIMDDRRVRKLRALRKKAAVKIATWYKGILLRRRQVELVSLIQRLRHLFVPYLAAQKVLVRQRCANRIVSFLEYTSTANMAVVGVRRLKAEVDVLQSSWRSALLVRYMQRQILYNQLTRLEREIVGANKRAERNVQNQMMRLGKSVNILEPDAAMLPPTRSFRGLSGSLSFRTQQALNAAGQQLQGGQGQGGQLQGGGMSGLQGGPQGGPQLSGQLGIGYDALAVIPANDGGGMGTTSRGVTNTRQYDRSRQPGRGVLLVHETGGEEDDEVLRGHTEMVPREVREQVVSSFLLDARREHRKLLEQYSNEKMLYLARKPIEEMRQKMLRDAGLSVEPDMKAPVMPHMRLVYPRTKLRELLRRAVEINAARLAAAEERRQQEAAAVAEGGRGGGGGGGGAAHWLSGERGGGGVLWADQAGKGGGGGERGRRTSLSRKSLAATSHRQMQMRMLPSAGL
ncbi:hypothetical protein PLESTB_001578300 [Pleodorina starrii]|uniref:Uncharacterized protein n=1 Tax=Pleodorina starrii TaxID=330485 RepID=A0A9W6BYF1_9CHLO|nr:hypothetical protein PLESTM_000726800 [Pleodorina starrii]GLC60142.1 hypothetical protein PLESTB_001578300 [Pleodorina starrii]GLC70046.1 hypothetical protein PLESTF_000917000 [Pleodorina starrii]